MKHGLKQEIKRGLSVLMAVSMVASSALPVMAEEVVEEAVEVEVVSEEVADEAGDVVVDVVEDEDVVEEVVNGEVVTEVTTEEAADAISSVCGAGYHAGDITYKAEWAFDSSTGAYQGVTVRKVCSKCGTIATSSSSDFVTKSYANITKGDFSNYSYVISEVKDGNATDCTAKYNAKYNVYRLDGDNVVKIGEEQNVVVTGNHSFGKSQYEVGKKATCTTNGTVVRYCTKCGQKIEQKLTDSADRDAGMIETTIKNGLENAPATSYYAQVAGLVLAKGHQYDASKATIEWKDDYKEAYMTLKCATAGCGNTVTVNVTNYIEVCATANGTYVIPSKFNFGAALCEGDCKLYYHFDTNLTDNNVVLTGLIKAVEQKNVTFDADSVVTNRISTAVKNVTVTDMKTPTVKSGSAAAVVFEIVKNTNGTVKYDKNGLPVVKATIDCATCKHTHDFYSDKDYSKRSYAVKVEVKEVSRRNARCTDEGTKKDEVVYEASLVLAGNTYAATSYTLASIAGFIDANKKGLVVERNGAANQWIIKYDPVGMSHSFNKAITNENAIKDDSFVAATCVNEGYGKFKCSICGETEERIIPALPHTFVEKEINTVATHTEDATYKAYCSVCKKQYTKDNTLEYARLWQLSSSSLVDCPEAQRNYDLRSKVVLNSVDEAKAKDLSACYVELQKKAVAELTAKDTKGHNYKVNEKAAKTVWSSDYSTVTVTFTCDRATGSECVNDTYTVKSGTNFANETSDHHVVKVVANTTAVVEVEPGFDTKGKQHFVATAKFTDKNNKTWEKTVTSSSVEMPATGKQETATVSITGKTVTYNGNRQYVAATTNSDVKPVVSYYKDAALTKKFSGAPYTAGTYYVKATVAESKKYTAAESEVVKLVIEKADPKVTISWKADKKDATKANITVKQKNIGAQKGNVKYKAKNSKIKVDSNGVVTFTNKAKEGTNYKVVINVKATTNYNGYTKTIKVNY